MPKDPNPPRPGGALSSLRGGAGRGLARLLRELPASILSGLWLALVAFPMVVLRFNPIPREVDFLWGRAPKLVAACVAASILFRFFRGWKAGPAKRAGAAGAALPGDLPPGPDPPPRPGALPGARADVQPGLLEGFLRSRAAGPAFALLGLLLLLLPFWSNPYSINIYITALIYITLGLGLNVVVGVSGLLNLGYVAFYAIGAYTYALLNHYFGLGFWVCLPLGALSATILGFLLGLPILRVSGDYLAIVTLGFAEIVRLLLTNLDLTRGPRGIANIGPPRIPFVDLNAQVKPALVSLGLLHPVTDLNNVLIYLIILVITALTIVCVHRLENSRLGRAWLALREDEVACQAMGVSRVRAKLTAFTLGSTWAGLAGVVFASQITFISPANFTFMQSVMILSIVVLGGMGSIPGVVMGAIILIALPESLRFFADYRMLLFGLLMVLMMVFRPEGVIRARRQVRTYEGPAGGGPAGGAPGSGGPAGGPGGAGPAGGGPGAAAPAEAQAQAGAGGRGVAG